MGKKVVLAVFGGIAVLGLLMSVVGWALGGRVGTLYVDEGSWEYTAGGKSLQMGQTPGWVDRMAYYVENWDNGWDHEFDDVFAYNEVITEGTAEAGYGTEDFAQPGWWVSGEAVQVDGAEQNVSLPFNVADLRGLNLEVDAGYVVIQEGAAPALSVRGPLPFESVFSDGVWTVSSNSNMGNIRTKNENQQTRFYIGRRDVTTVFTLTVPKGTAFLEGDLGLGAMQVKNIEVQDLDLSLSLGSVQIEGGKADTSTLHVELGDMRVNGFITNECDIYAELGRLDFVGTVNTYLNASCDLGSITARLAKPANGYYATAQADMGHILVDGQSVTMGEHSFGSEDIHSLEMNLDCNMGNLEIGFGEANTTTAAVEAAALPAADAGVTEAAAAA